MEICCLMDGMRAYWFEICPALHDMGWFEALVASLEIWRLFILRISGWLFRGMLSEACFRLCDLPGRIGP
jgi:hypothetical protein